MNRREFVAALAERIDTDKRSAEEALQAVLDLITETVSKGEAVAISGFAKFARKMSTASARMGRNPQTGEAILHQRIRARCPHHAAQGVQGRGAHWQGAAEEDHREEDRRRRRRPRRRPRRKGTGEEGHTAKKAPAKKATAKKTTAAKKTTKKTTAKKAPAKKTTRA